MGRRRRRTRPPGPKRRWTEEERAFVAANYGRMSFAEMGRRLGRTAEGVRGIASRYRLVKNAEPLLEPDAEARTEAEVRLLVQRFLVLEQVVGELEEERERWRQRIARLEATLGDEAGPSQGAEPREPEAPDVPREEEG